MVCDIRYCIFICVVEIHHSILFYLMLCLKKMFAFILFLYLLFWFMPGCGKYWSWGTYRITLRTNSSFYFRLKITDVYEREICYSYLRLEFMMCTIVRVRLDEIEEVLSLESDLVRYKKRLVFFHYAYWAIPKWVSYVEVAFLRMVLLVSSFYVRVFLHFCIVSESCELASSLCKPMSLVWKEHY